MLSFGAPGRKTVFAAVGLAAALGAGGTAFAMTSSPSSPPAGTSASTPGRPATALAVHAGRRHRLALLQRADHATIEIKVKGKWVTYTLDRGKVTAVSPSSITLLRPDGQTVTEQITSSTKYGGVGAETQVRTDQPAMVISDNGTALRIRQRP